METNDKPARALRKKEEVKKDLNCELDSNEVQSAISATSRKTNRNKDKHCIIDKCEGKKQSGPNWSKHLRTLHPGVAGQLQEGVHFVTCTTTDCCDRYQGLGYKGSQPSRVCRQCNKPKRHDHFPQKDSVLCKVCSKGIMQGTSKSVIVPREHELDLTAHLSEANLRRLQYNAPGPCDSASMLGVKRGREETERLKHPTEVDYDNDQDIVDDVPKRLKSSSGGQPQPQQSNNSVPPRSLAESNLDSSRIVFVAHTDYQVIDILKELEKGDLTEQVRAQQLQEICHMFSQEAIFNFLTEAKGGRLADIVILVQKRGDKLSNQQLVGLVMASIALGGACWQGSVHMLSSSSQSETVLMSLKPYLKKAFSQELVEWLCAWWRIAEQSQLDLMHKLSQSSTSVDYTVMMLSVVTAINDQSTFVLFSAALAKTAPACINLILSNINEYPKQQKLSFQDLLDLTSILQQSDYSDVISNINNKLSAAQVHQWRELIVTESANAKIINSSSVQAFIDELSLAYGNINQFAGDATTQFQDFQILLSEAPLKPNDRQLALSQYCVGKLYGDSQRQLWVVQSGQGKARIIVSSVVLALISGSVTKVHIVFDSKHLMERDMKDFEAYWVLLGYDNSRVEYHLGCDFTPSQGELIVVDEIDAIMFKDPTKFSEMIDGCLVLGFTATPDNFNPTGAERKVIDLLKFQKYHYVVGQDNEVQPDMLFNEVVTCDSVSTKADFIKRQAKAGPVLVYCDETLANALRTSKCDPLVITENIDPVLLRNLDKVLENGLYRVLVAQEQSSMRGYDYRAPSCQMTLVINRSFQNLREAIQGYNRVGRFGDQCKRIRFSDVALVDQRASLEYTGVLLRASLQLQKRPPQVKKIQVKKPTGVGSKLTQKRFEALLQQPTKASAIGQPSVSGFFKPSASKEQKANHLSVPQHPEGI